jgi:PST family polysaccharide transporter
MYMVYLPLVYWLARKRTGFRWSPGVIRDVTLLLVACVAVAACAAWDEWLGAVVGLLAAGCFGVISLVRLARMVELGGVLGRLAFVMRKYVFKLRC